MKFGIRLHVIVRETNSEAWDAANDLIRYVDDAADARTLANASDALGPKTLGRIEVLGKARFMRATVRASNLAVQTLVGLVGLMAGLASACIGIGQTAVLRLTRSVLRRGI